MHALLLSRAGRDAAPAGATEAGTAAVAGVALGKGLAGGAAIVALAVAAYLWARPQPAPERDVPQSGAPALSGEGREAAAQALVLLAGPRRERPAPAELPAVATHPADSLAGLG